MDSSIEIIDCILMKFVSIPLNMYDVDIVGQIYNFCVQWLQCIQNENIKESQTIKTWHGGLKLLERAMQHQRDKNESDIPITTTQKVRIQTAAQEKLTQLLEHKDMPPLYKLSDALNKIY